MPSRYDQWFIFDDPVPFWTHNIPQTDRKQSNISFSVYPVGMRNYLYFHYYVDVLLQDKRIYGDDPMIKVKVLSMSYLEFLFFSHNKDNQNKNMIDGLLRLCLKLDDMDRIGMDFDEKGKPFIIIVDKDDKEVEHPILMDGSDFDLFSEIVCEQNLIDRIDFNISADVKKSLEEAEAIRNRINGTKMGSLEDQMIALAVSSGWTFDDMYDMNIRKFIKSLQRADAKLHYSIYLSASMNGMVEFKDRSFIKHWLADLTEDKYKDAKIDYEQTKDRFAFKDKM
jgi:hypothetical protein